MKTAHAYRADIDVLRAIAVLSVIIFHISPEALPGGFIGVDIFFIISGYLITGIIQREITEDRFSIQTFYARRIKRIFPAFFTVLISTLIVGTFILLPSDYSTLYRSAIYAVFFGANIFFTNEGEGYFSPRTEEMPLLHMWSLSVEEQFYFFFPLILIAFHKVQALKPKAYLLGFITIFMVISFIIAQKTALSIESSKFSYFSLVTRCGELMMGSFLALIPCKQYKRLNPYITVTGLALIVLSMLFLSKYSIFPGINAIWPCLGAVLVIYAGNGNNFFWVKKLFTNPLLISIGLISYSLYLWHWPILAYMRYILSDSHLPGLWIIGSLVLMFTLAILSYRFVEQPTRKLKSPVFRLATWFYVLPLIGILGIKHGMSISANKILDRTDDPKIMNYEGSWEICHNKLLPNCKRGADKQTTDVLVIGDSHVAHLNPFIDIIAKDQGWSSTVMSASACAPIPGFDVDQIKQADLQDSCTKLITKLEEEIHNYENIILSLRWDIHFGLTNIDIFQSTQEFDNLFQQYISSLVDQGKNVFILGQIPLYKRHVARGYWMNIRYNKVDKTYRMANIAAKNIALEHNLEFIDLAAIAEKWEDGYSKDGVPLYRDDNHLNFYGSEQLALHALEKNDLDWFKTIMHRNKTLPES